MLAIHVTTDDGLFLGSLPTDSKNPDTVFALLKKEFGQVPEQILLIENDEVVEHWVAGEDYDCDD